ncbi:hypothetical protein N7517_006384 [Penicillium concentricum]|uniref:Uncharacterized protein n=1 Tax=Penicillium concentricum TaxID=293559 RepID=A0A9W9V9Y3_9EURO|nr:uncharacterized protein N7517_006384 [Penicillium concentricum]KAJ5374378.1 hypothetical protein N7517_006384 [Penicillium concentricum]
MEIRDTETLFAPTAPSSGVVEATVVSPTEIDEDCYQNMDERQETQHHYDRDELEVPKLRADGNQDPKTQDNLDELEVPQLPLDNQISPRPYNIRITTALKALADKNISMVEYGAEVQLRCGYEEVPVVVEWGVPDEQLSRASQILVENHFPRLFTRTRSWFGYWETRCLRHDLDGAGWMCVHLLPLSLVGFTLEDATELRKLRIGDASRLRVEKDLLSFISSYILRGPPGHINPELLHRLFEQQSNEELLKKLDEGVRFIKKWDWGNVEETDLALAERVVRDCQYVGKLTDVTWDPARPCTTPEPVSPIE